MPVMTVMTRIITIAGRICLMSVASSGQTDGGDEDVDQLDTDERYDDPADTIEQQVATQDRRRTNRPVGDTAQRQRDQRDNDQRVEDDCRQNSALWRLQPHHV